MSEIAQEIVPATVAPTGPKYSQEFLNNLQLVNDIVNAFNLLNQVIMGGNLAEQAVNTKKWLQTQHSAVIAVLKAHKDYPAYEEEQKAAASQPKS